jgi:peptide subunit release factor 1 (eRF1)
MQQFIKEVDWLVQTKQAHHLVLAGPAEVTSELRTLLPKRLALRVVGTASVSIDAATSELLTAMLTIAEDYERNTELQTVQEIVRAAGNEKTVAGLGRTLKAINAGRVGELIYSEGLRSPGLECSNCAALFSSEKDSCASCGGILQPVADVVERAVERVRQTGANVEMVTGEAGASLNSVGGIGAFLKAKSVSIRA